MSNLIEWPENLPRSGRTFWGIAIIVVRRTFKERAIKQNHVDGVLSCVAYQGEKYSNHKYRMSEFFEGKYESISLQNPLVYIKIIFKCWIKINIKVKNKINVREKKIYVPRLLYIVIYLYTMLVTFFTRISNCDGSSSEWQRMDASWSAI